MSDNSPPPVEAGRSPGVTNLRVAFERLASEPHLPSQTLQASTVVEHDLLSPSHPVPRQRAYSGFTADKPPPPPVPPRPLRNASSSNDLRAKVKRAPPPPPPRGSSPSIVPNSVPWLPASPVVSSKEGCVSSLHPLGPFSFTMISLDVVRLINFVSSIFYTGF